MHRKIPRRARVANLRPEERLRDDDADALDGVVAEAVEVPRRLERLRPPRGVGRAADQLVLAPLRVPGEAPAGPRVARGRRADLGAGPRPPAVGADLDPLDGPPARPRAALEHA